MKVLVLAGGFDQIALIKELKSRGHIVYLADYFSDPPAKKYADKHFQVSTLDEELIEQIAVTENVDLITTACTDQALMTVARVSEKMGLPCYITSETAKNVTNKAYMKRRFAEYGVPTANWILLEKEESFLDDLSLNIQFPMIVKPCDCNSSKGVKKVNSTNQLVEAIQQAFSLSRSKKVVVEDFVEGEEVSIDIWKDAEGAKVLSVSKTSKIKENVDNFTIFQSKYPVEMSEILAERIRDTAQRICNAFDLNNCPILIQAIIKDDNIKVIEFSARMGGGTKYKLIEYMSGINIMRTYVNRVLGDQKQIVEPKWSNKKIELNYVYTYNGKVTKIVGFNKFIQEGKIKSFFQYKPIGCVIEKRTTSSDRVLGFLIQEDSWDAVESVRREIISNVDIYDERGKSIMLKEPFESL